MESAISYIPIDRRQALARGERLPDRTSGAALFADISGFTPLTEALTRRLGPRYGAEELTRHLNRVYDALIDEVDRYGGSVISFSGDAITCWFDDGSQADPASRYAALRATTCALAMQAAMKPLAVISLPDEETVKLAMKVAIASGPARRFLVGDEAIQLVDTLAGGTLVRMAVAEHHANQGEVVLDATTAAQLGDALQVLEWRTDAETGDRFALVGGLAASPAEPPSLLAPSAPLPEAQARAWLLPAVYERISEGLGEILTELRPAVALFLRFDGIDYEGDDAAGKKLDAFIRWVQSVLVQYEGFLLQLSIGDKGSYLYAAFGAPLAHEDDARRAVSAALDLRAPPPALNFIRSVQIGISQGTMRTGPYGGMTRRTYGVLGDEVNLAARLMQHAGPGEVLVSGRVQQAAPGAFAWEPLPPIRVKGKREPVIVARLLGKQHGQAAATFYAGALVGRDAELAQLTHFVQPIFEGRFVGLMYVYGEPGIGKSRLVYEMRQRLEREPLLKWFTCPAEGILRQSLNPFQYFLREYFEQNADSSEEKNKARFDALLDAFIADLQRVDFPPQYAAKALELAQELERTRSFLGALAGGLRWEGSLYEQVEPKLRFENTLTAAKALILAESLWRPVVLHVEDAHLLDADSELFLKTLTRNVEAYHFTVLLTSRYRDDGSRYALDVDADVPQSAIDLNQLSPDGIRAMAGQVLGSALDDELAGFLAEKTNGNPFFVEQLALDLRERGLLSTTAIPAHDGQEATQVTSLTDRIRIEEVPANINAVLVARLDRLAAQIKALVQTAAVLGQEFEVWVLSRMLREDERLPVKVKQAEAEAIWSALSETRYLFKHALLRDAAYDMQLRARLRELHALAGAAIEQVYADDVAAHVAILAYHWGAAGDAVKEAHYSVLAGQQALRISAFRDALRYLKRSLELLPDEGDSDLVALIFSGSASTANMRAQLYYWLGEAYDGLGELREAQQSFQVSLGLARACDNRQGMTGALSYLGGLALRLGEAEQAETHLKEGLALAREIDDQPGIATALLRLGYIAIARGEYPQAKQFLGESVALARVTNLQVVMANALNALGVVGTHTKALQEAQHYLEEAQTVFKAIGNRRGVILTLGNMGQVTSSLGHHAEAKSLYREALDLSLEIGDRRLRAALLDNLGEVAYELGDNAQAEHDFSESLRLALEIGAVPSALLTLAGMTRLRARAGHSEQALEWLGLTLNHPACDDETRQRGDPLLAELRASLPPDVVEAALERGRAQSLEAVASEILKK
jgi:class 3 adenylate cyclase/tetratricopeptide (TPR) repeat protein